MVQFARVETTLSQRPVLLPEEVILQTCIKTSIQENKVPLQGYERGTLYLTTQRLIWIEEEGQKKAIAIPLSQVKKWTFTSAKIGSDQKLVIAIPKQDESMASARQHEGVQWLCLICQEKNQQATKSKCSLCGMPFKPETVKRLCGVCTFENKGDRLSCEMCDTTLAFPDEVNEHKTPQFDTLQDCTTLRFLIKAATLKQWEKDFAQALEAKPRPVTSPLSASTPTRGERSGLDALLSAAEAAQQRSFANLDDAFKDMSALMSKASELTTMVEVIQSRLATETKSKQDEADLSDLSQKLAYAGISSPIIKAQGNQQFHYELSRELADFVTPVLRRQGGIMPITDIYCIYNRGRGAALISPHDLIQAVQHIDRASGGAVLLKTHATSFQCLQIADMSDEVICQKVIACLDTKTCLDAYTLAKHLSLSQAVAQQYLYLLEAKAKLCRDESSEGIKFYANRFLST